MIFCCFTLLDDLKGEQRSDAKLVLKTIMNNGGRFSAFDAYDIPMAQTLTFIERNWTKRRKPDCGYPWVEVDLTEAGKAALVSHA